MSTIRRLRRKMSSTPKPDLPVPPPYKFNQLPEDYRRILNYLFDNLIETSHFLTSLGLTNQELRIVLEEMFDKGELRVCCDKSTPNGQIDPESLIGLELWNCTANTFTLI